MPLSGAWLGCCSMPSSFSAMSASSNSPVRRRESTARLLLRRLLGLMLLVALGWFCWLYFQINAVGGRDEARAADAIAVFGAAEYSGRASPVLHARLDHAVDLYREKMAALGITLGGGNAGA